MIIISQFALQAEIWFTFPEETHHTTCKMSERENNTNWKYGRIVK